MNPMHIQGDSSFWGVLVLLCIVGIGYLLGKLKILSTDSSKVFVQAVSIAAGLYVVVNFGQAAPASNSTFTNLIGGLVAGILVYFVVSILVGLCIIEGVRKAEDENDKS